MVEGADYREAALPEETNGRTTRLGFRRKWSKTKGYEVVGGDAGDSVIV